MAQNYYELFLEKKKDRIALIEDGISFTYGEILTQVDGVAINQKQNQKENEEEHAQGKVRFFFCEKPSVDLIRFLAAMKMGEIPVLVPSDEHKKFSEEYRKAEREKSLEYKDCACMGVATSGSTGVPKVFYRSYESWANFFDTQNEVFGITEDTVLFAQGPLAFTGNLNIYLGVFYAGGCVVTETTFRPKAWREMILDYAVNAVYLIPAKLKLLVRCYEGENNRITSIISGSQSMNARDAKELAMKFPDGDLTLYYGGSEVSYVSYLRGEDMTEDYSDVGSLFPGISVEIQGEEIYVDTPYHVFGVECPYTLRDQGYFDEKGHLHLAGRGDDIILKRGRKISLSRIENVIKKEKAVKECAVIFREEKVMAFLELWEKEDLSIPALKKQMRLGLASYEMPDTFTVLENMPLLESGKVNRARL